MKVSGFTFIKNALIYDYPILEAIQSILPICDEVIVAVGQSDDDTLALIQAIDSPKIRIIQTVWDESLRSGGRVLAAETDKAYAAIAPDTDWAIYIQADEVVHEQYLPQLQAAMQANLDNKTVEGLLLKYLHFYGSYDYVGSSSRWYRHEIRILRYHPNIRSYRDAQGFRWQDDKKLSVAPVDAYMYHYGWVKEPAAMQRKQENFNKYWHSDEWVNQNVRKAEAFDYQANVSALRRFLGSHPKVMQNRIAALNWQFDYDISYNRRTLKERVKRFFRRYLGLDFSYKNYILIKK
jgi:glycosyltransferase involved in cell wall biosynthesis